MGPAKSGFIVSCLFIGDIQIYAFLFRSSLPTRPFRWWSLFYGCDEATKVGLERRERLLGGPVERNLDLLEDLPDLQSTAFSVHSFEESSIPKERRTDLVVDLARIGKVALDEQPVRLDRSEEGMKLTRTARDDGSERKEGVWMGCTTRGRPGSPVSVSSSSAFASRE